MNMDDLIVLLVPKLQLGNKMKKLAGRARPYFDTSARTGLVGPYGAAFCIGFS